MEASPTLKQKKKNLVGLKRRGIKSINNTSGNNTEQGVASLVLTESAEDDTGSKKTVNLNKRELKNDRKQRELHRPASTGSQNLEGAKAMKKGLTATAKTQRPALYKQHTSPHPAASAASNFASQEPMPAMGVSTGDGLNLQPSQSASAFELHTHHHQHSHHHTYFYHFHNHQYNCQIFQ